MSEKSDFLRIILIHQKEGLMKHWKLIFIIVTLIINYTFGQNSTQPPTVISNPIYLGFDVDFKGTENLILVPENRSNPNSRLIPVHFLKLDAKEKTNLPPVFYFRGGPGEATSPKDFYPYYTKSKRSGAFAFEVTQLNQKHDVILMSQRGSSISRGLPLYRFKYQYYLGNKDEAHDFKKQKTAKRAALSKALNEYEQLGVDPAGYDIMNLIADIEDVRAYYGYDKIMMVGNSFGSQTALAYLQKYPNRVDRAFLSAIEPLDHTYDAPDDLWQLLQRIEQRALQDEKLKKHLPKIGLLEAFKVVVQRLRKAPVSVVLDFPNGKKDTVVIGLDDLYQSKMYPYSKSRKNALENFPKYITELYHGDYRSVALAALEGRVGYETDDIMPLQVDHSLGITAKRLAKIDQQEARKWLGDINIRYKQINGVATSKVVNDDFRTQKRTTIPMVLFHGDLDKNTSINNAHYLMKYLENGHLIIAKNGTHGTKWDAFLKDEAFGKRVLAFMDIDFEKISFQQFKQQLPTSFEFESLEFTPIEGKALFEILMEKEN